MRPGAAGQRRALDDRAGGMVGECRPTLSSFRSSSDPQQVTRGLGPLIALTRAGVARQHGTDFAELTSCQPYFDAKDTATMDALAKKRCKALMSVDDTYVGILDAVEKMGQLNRTYVLLSSDHGYNLGHHVK